MLQREAWLEWIAQAEGGDLVFLDETGAKTNMTPAYARAPKGQRAVDFAPHGHWNTTTLVAAITAHGPIAPMVLDGPMDRAAFEAYVAQVLVHELPPKATVIMDNLSAHKSCAMAKALAQAGAQLRYLPPYSPDFNPIEAMWAKVKTNLRKDKARTKEDLNNAIATALNQITPSDAKGFFQHCFVRMQT
jgi:transposase